MVIVDIYLYSSDLKGSDPSGSGINTSHTTLSMDILVITVFILYICSVKYFPISFSSSFPSI